MRADVRLEQSRSADDQTESEVEGRDRRDRHREVARRDDAAADEDRVLLAQDPIGDPASREGEEIDATDIEAVDRGGGLVRHAEAARSEPTRPGTG